jgi:hypothetical protein
MGKKDTATALSHFAHSTSIPNFCGITATLPGPSFPYTSRTDCVPQLWSFPLCGTTTYSDPQQKSPCRFGQTLSWNAGKSVKLQWHFPQGGFYFLNTLTTQMSQLTARSQRCRLVASWSSSGQVSRFATLKAS